ncbi:hypothetical protein XENOCAPTIV_028920, partial [Xenoophorus captivus]
SQRRGRISGLSDWLRPSEETVSGPSSIVEGGSNVVPSFHVDRLVSQFSSRFFAQAKSEAQCSAAFPRMSASIRTTRSKPTILAMESNFSTAVPVASTSRCWDAGSAPGEKMETNMKASNRSADCVFVEMVLENHYTALMSARYTGWYVGFTKRGRPRRGPHTLPNQQDVHFMKRFPPGEQPDLTTPFRFTTISKRVKRVRATGTR